MFARILTISTHNQIYCVLCAIYGTGNLSVASIAMLEQGASNFRAMIFVTLRYVQRFGDFIHVIEQYYKTRNWSYAAIELEGSRLHCICM